MSTLAERLNEALEESGLTISQLAQAIGVKHSTVSFWKSGKTKTMNAANANAAADALGVSVRWLVDGEGEKHSKSVRVLDDGEELPEEFVAIPFYKIRFAAGDDPGQITYEELTEVEPMYYSRKYMQKKHLSKNSARCFDVTGFSMEPTICNGDKILVDCSYQPILDGRVYAFAFHGALRVKRLYKRMTGALLVRSDNPDRDAYPDEILQGDDLAGFKLIGRVIDRSGGSNL